MFTSIGRDRARNESISVKKYILIIYECQSNKYASKMHARVTFQYTAFSVATNI